MGQLGDFLGICIVVFYLLAVSNYIVKWLNRTLRKQEKGSAGTSGGFKKVMQFIVRHHKVFGMLTIVFILAHFLVQVNVFGMRYSGVLAAAIMLLQVGLGIYLSKHKPKTKTLLYVHRTIAVLLAIAIVAHVSVA